MPTQVQFRRGSTAQNNSFTGAAGELSVNTSNNSVRVHDGSTAGGTELATLAYASNASNLSTGTLGSTRLPTSGVSADTYGGASKVPVITVDTYGRITSASNVNVAGVSTFSASGNTFTIGTADGGTFSASIQTNSVRLSTDTTGDYVQNVLPGAGIAVSGAVGEGRDATVALTTTGVAATTYGGASKVPVLAIDQYGRITSAANVNVAGVTNFAASGNTFTISTADGGSFSASIQLDSVRLGTDTTGAYVSNLIAGTGVTLTGLGNEGTTPTIAIGQAVSTTSDVTFRDVVVSGNLTVSGTQTIINTNVIELADNQITLNSDHTGSPTQDAGVVVNRGSSANVSIFWDETNDRWSLNNSSATYIVHNTGRDVVLGTETSGNYVATVAAGTGISTTGASSGEGIAHSISLATSGVSASTYGGAAVQPVLTVDTYGRITSASNVTSTVANTNITGNIIGSQIAATGVTAGSYGGVNNIGAIVVDQQGRITSAANVASTTAITQVGTISTGTWQGTSISTTYTDAKIASVSNTAPISATTSGGAVTVAHLNSGVAATTYGSAAIVPVYTVNATGHITSASNVTISIPSSALNTDVALGSQTSGNYVATVAAGTGISTTGASSGEGIAHSISLATSGVSAATYGGGGSQIPTLVVDTYGRVTSAANVATTSITSLGTITTGTWQGSSISTTYTDAKLTSVSATSPIATSGSTGAITLSHAASGVAATTYGSAAIVPVYTVNSSGHITSASNVTISIPSSAINTDVALGSQTSGNYVATLAAGTGISTTGASSGEGIGHTVSLATSGVSAATYGGASTAAVITVDAYGRITSASNATIVGGVTQAQANSRIAARSIVWGL